MGRKWTEEQRLARSIEYKTDPLCPQCKETNPQKFYYDSQGRRTNAYCSDCHKAKSSQRYHSKTMMQKRANRASIYGLTPEQYLDLYNSQNGKCAICKKEPETKRGLAIDHNHETGKVRGLLCHHCNIGIGNFMENIDLMNDAIIYLKENL